jgi:hypothetical protein
MPRFQARRDALALSRLQTALITRVHIARQLCDPAGTRFPTVCLGRGHVRRVARSPMQIRSRSRSSYSRSTMVCSVSAEALSHAAACSPCPAASSTSVRAGNRRRPVSSESRPVWASIRRASAHSASSARRIRRCSCSALRQQSLLRTCRRSQRQPRARCASSSFFRDDMRGLPCRRTSRNIRGD